METAGHERPAKVSRIQENLLAARERRLLNWLCPRMPKWATPDMLTATGLVGACLILAGYGLSLADEDWLWICIAGYVLHWVGDSMDGSLARFRGIERPRYGYFLDHSCDALATVMILAGIGLSPYVRMETALVAAAGYLLLSVHAFLAARVLSELRLSYLAAGPTELRILLIGLTLAMLVFGDGARDDPAMTGFDWFVQAAGGLLIVLFVFQTIRTGRALSAIDPTPHR